MNHQISISWINPINLSLPKISVYVLILEGRHFLICYAVESTCLSPRSSIHLNWRLSEHLLLTNHQREGKGWKWKLFAPPLCCQSVKPLNIPPWIFKFCLPTTSAEWRCYLSTPFHYTQLPFLSPLHLLAIYSWFIASTHASFIDSIFTYSLPLMFS